MVCPECEKRSVSGHLATCYPCHVRSIGFTYRGGGFQAGRSNFKARTNAEFLAEHVGEVRGNPNIEKV
jgi:hypothetical protein